MDHFHDQGPALKALTYWAEASQIMNEAVLCLLSPYFLLSSRYLFLSTNKQTKNSREQ